MRIYVAYAGIDGVQGVFNPTAAGYFVGPRGQPLPMHVAAEMSGAGGNWYPPDQHHNPVAVREDVVTVSFVLLGIGIKYFRDRSSNLRALAEMQTSSLVIISSWYLTYEYAPEKIYSVLLSQADLERDL